LIFPAIRIKLLASDSALFGERIPQLMPIVRALLALVASPFRSRLPLQLEILALRHQLTIYERSIRRPRVRLTDRLFWSWLSRG
jgi:hypothetical protein